MLRSYRRFRRIYEILSYNLGERDFGSSVSARDFSTANFRKDVIRLQNKNDL